MQEGWGNVMYEHSPMQDIQQIARHSLPFLRYPCLVDASLQRSDQLIAVLLDHESDKLLHKPKIKNNAHTRKRSSVSN